MNNKLLDPSIVFRKPLSLTLIIPTTLGGMWLGAEVVAGKFIPNSPIKRMSEVILVIGGIVAGGLAGIAIANYIVIKSNEKK